MSLVRYSTGPSPPEFGIRHENRIIPVHELVSQAESDDLERCLVDLEYLDARGRDSLLSGDERGLESNTVDYHPPINQGKIIRVEGSYKHHVEDGDYNPFLDTQMLSEMSWPRIWAAPPSAVCKPGQAITLPAFATDVRPGVELACVIRSPIKNVGPEEAVESVAGAMVFGSMGIFDKLPGQWGYKFFDSALVGSTGITPTKSLQFGKLELSVQVNGTRIDTSTTAELRFPVPEIIAAISEMMTLQSGDLVLTGDPIRADQPLAEGDRFTGAITGIESVEAPVVREQVETSIRI